MTDRRAWFLLVAALLATGPVRAEVVLLGKGALPGTARDRSGLSAPLEDGTPGDRLGAIGSAIAYTGEGHRYLVVPDRGPNATTYRPEIDNTTSWHDRFDVVDLAISIDRGVSKVVPSLVSTTLLADESGRPLIGLSTAFDTRFDPEGARVSNDGRSVFVSDEYGPFVDQFDRATGRRVKRFAMPAAFMPAERRATGAEEDAANTRGRIANRGMEGLAITPDGRSLVGIMQSPLLQDGGRDGIHLRIVRIDIASGATRQFVYPLADPRLGVSEIVAVNDHVFLVDERDGRGGTKSVAKNLYRIDLDGATDVSDIDRLPARGLPAGTKAVSKTLFIDLLKFDYGFRGDEDFPDKIEGLAFGPDLPDGRHVLVVTNDNDFVADVPTWFFVFAFADADLPGYVPQRFESRR